MAVDIWNVDCAAIRAYMKERNRIRAAALLPLIDEQKEFEDACNVIRDIRWRAFCNGHQEDFERFHAQVLAERGPVRGWMDAGSKYDDAWQRFKTFLYANYADEIAALKIISPDYLTITKRVIEEAGDDRSETFANVDLKREVESRND